MNIEYFVYPRARTTGTTLRGTKSDPAPLSYLDLFWFAPNNCRLSRMLVKILKHDSCKARHVTQTQLRRRSRCEPDASDLLHSSGASYYHIRSTFDKLSIQQSTSTNFVEASPVHVWTTCVRIPPYMDISRPKAKFSQR